MPIYKNYNFMKFVIVMIYLLYSSNIQASNFKPVMIFDGEKILDGTWNEAIHNGIKKFERKFGIPVKETIVSSNSEAADINELVKAINSHARDGFNPIMINSIDKETKQAIREVMDRYPKRRFIVFNGTYNIPNAHFFVFSYQEVTFLAGYLAAKKSKANKLGFIGGMDVPLIRNALCGYIKGARYAKSDVNVEYAFVSERFEGWSSPSKAYDLAIQQIANGADVLYAPAGGSAEGVLKAADDKSVLGIGADMNQNHLYPGSILTSVLVNVGNAAYRSLLASHRNIWREQLKVLGLQENGVGLAFDEHNASLITNELKAEIEQLTADIILKRIDLPNYVFTNECNDKNGNVF
jgi:basic membrane protein A